MAGSIPDSAIRYDRRGFRSAEEIIRDDLVEGYTKQVRDPDSFASGLLRTQQAMLQLQTAAAAGDMEGAKALYDGIGDFYARHQNEVAEAVGINPRGNHFLEAIQRGALVGVNRDYDGIAVRTPRGMTTAGQLFGEGRAYEQLRSTEVLRSQFDQSVADVMSGEFDAVGDRPDASRWEALRRVMSPVVDHVVAGVRRGEEPALVVDADSHRRLASRLAATGYDDIASVGEDGVRAIVSHVLSKHMSDATAVSMYDWMVGEVSARRAASGDDGSFSAAKTARRLADGYESTVRALAGGGQPSDALHRFASMMVGSLAEGASPLDFDDPGTRLGMSELADLVARSSRAGVSIVPVLQANGSTGVKAAMREYLNARRQQVPPSPDNLFARAMGVHDAVQGLITSPDWAPATAGSRANPDAERGTAAGVFRVSSGSRGLDRASVGLFSGLVQEAVRTIASSGRVVAADEAVRDALTDPEARSRVVRSLARAMQTSSDVRVSEGVAAHVVDELASGGGGGLAGAISRFAFGTSVSGATPEERAEFLRLRRNAMQWYAANIGPAGRYYEDLIAASGWEQLLYDPVLGYGDVPADRARHIIDSHIQQAKLEMQAKASRGQSPAQVVNAKRSLGTFYYVAGFRDSAGNLHGGDYKPRPGDEPVIERGFGDLNSVAQPYEGISLGGAPVPVVPLGSYGRDTESRLRFRNAMSTMKSLYNAQQAAMREAVKSSE